MNKKRVYIVGSLIIVVFILLGWFQCNRFEELKEKTLYYDKTNFQRIYYYIRYHLFEEAHRGGIDLIKVDADDVKNYNYAEPLKIVKNIKQKNLMAEKVLLAKTNPHKESVELFFYDSVLIKPQDTKENSTIINALNSFKNLLPTGESFGEDYSIRLNDTKILLVEPIINSKNNDVLGFLGIVFTSDLIAENVLPKIFKAYRFPEDSTKYVVQVVDYPQKRILYSNAPNINLDGEEPDYSLPVAFVFNNWMIQIYLLGFSIEDTAIQAFYLNMGISTFVLISLLVGMIIIFRVAQKEQKLSQMKSDFIANISHELKTPLSVIQVAGENLKNNKIKGSDRQKQYGQFIYNETQRLVGFVDKILNFVHLESGNYKYDFVESNINDIIMDVYSSFEIRLKEERFQCKLNFDNNLPEIKIDQILIREVLYNLVDNAIKYSNNKKELLISSRTQENEVQVIVEDNGAGISKSDQKYIFDKFYRGGKSNIHNTKGSGFGLSLSKKIIEDHGGRITLISAPNKGSKFIVHLRID